MSSSFLAPRTADRLPIFRNDGRTVALVLVGLREQLLLDSPEFPALDAVFDDLEVVLGEHAVLAIGEVENLTPRLHAALRRIIHVAPQNGSGVRPETAAASRGLLTERFPDQPLPALAHLRRLAMTVSNLLDELLEEPA
ncbi:hypothetical protein SRB5_15640 [Streptomyces sp. RB5]|uniref:Uncharacterized protein n=1 Tax=Streptomyces smaragdinus TaxID=2585196 RepID=A0A7K0CDI9_9ACTN|nr:DUF6415 family natural product biosynthesis protein [Streptomyces smaragdinus]MQY11446.1 hypothetical protein [Streptomyces smaragdinus]